MIDLVRGTFYQLFPTIGTQDTLYSEKCVLGSYVQGGEKRELRILIRLSQYLNSLFGAMFSIHISAKVLERRALYRVTVSSNKIKAVKENKLGMSLMF